MTFDYNDKAYKRFMSLQERARKNLSLRIITDEGGNVVGKIITRYTKSNIGCNCAVGLALYKTKDDVSILLAEKNHGYGYDMERANIEYILFHNKEKLLNAYLDVDSVNDLFNHWEQVFTNANYNVIQVL